MALSNISKSRGMMNLQLFLYASAIALSWAGVVDLSPAFILNFMQLGVRSPSVEMMPCWIAFFFSDLVFHRSL